MDPRVKQKRIPTILALVLLAFGIGVTYLLVQRGTFIVSQAAPDYEPRSVRVSNVTDSSFTISFVTVDPTIAAIEIEETGEYVLDDRGEEIESTVHYFTVEGVESESGYTFNIVSGGDEYRDGSYSVTTAAELQDLSDNEVLSGKVLLPSGGGAEGVVVYMSVDVSQLVSTLTSSDGTYTFDFASGLRTDDLAGSVTLEEGDSLNIVAEQGDRSSNVTAYYSPSLPPVTLGRNFDFTAPETIITPSTESAALSIPERVGVYSFSVASPLQGETLIDTQPIISGTGVPDTRVSLSLLPLGIKDNVVVGDAGQWEYRPSTQLPQGGNTLSAIGVDSDGTSRVTEVEFEVFAEGSRVSQSATPSATPVVTAAPTSTPTPEVTATPVPTTASPSPTEPVGGENLSPTASPSPTLTPSPTPFLKVTPTPPGNVGGVFLTFVSLAFIVGGATLLFLLG